MLTHLKLQGSKYGDLEMGLTINTNVASLIAQYNLSKNTKALNKTTEQLASGQRINHSADDATGLSISEKMRSQIRGIAKASENAQDGVNLLQVAEGGISVIVENLQRIRDLTIQAANDSNSSVERNSIKIEVQLRIKDIQSIKAATNFNGIALLDGSVSNYTLRVGAGSNTASNSLDISDALKDIVATFVSTNVLTAAISAAYASGTAARQFLDQIDEALIAVGAQRSTLGALQNRLQSTVINLGVFSENLTAAESRIKNVDIAQVTAELTRNQILQQASVSILAQANQMPALAVDLIKQSAA